MNDDLSNSINLLYNCFGYLPFYDVFKNREEGIPNIFPHSVKLKEMMMIAQEVLDES